MDKKENIDNATALEKIKAYIKTYCPDVDFNIRFSSEDEVVPRHAAYRMDIGTIPPGIVLRWRNNSNENYANVTNNKMADFLYGKGFAGFEIANGILQTNVFLEKIDNPEGDSRYLWDRLTEDDRAKNFNENYKLIQEINQYITHKYPFIRWVSCSAGELEKAQENAKVIFSVFPVPGNDQKTIKMLADEFQITDISKRDSGYGVLLHFLEVPLARIVAKPTLNIPVAPPAPSPLKGSGSLHYSYGKNSETAGRTNNSSLSSNDSPGDKGDSKRIKENDSEKPKPKT